MLTTDRDPNARKFENQKFNELKEEAVDSRPMGNYRTTYKSDSYGWKRLFIEQQYILGMSGGGERHVWKTKAAYIVSGRDEAKKLHNVVSTARDDRVSFEHVLVAYRREPLTPAETKAYRFGKRLQNKGWMKLGAFVKNVFASDADSVLNPPKPA